jgi:very-short-patch-repair endonuclease
VKAPDLLTQLRATGLPEPATEYRFCPGRLFRADYCWIPQRLILEIEGGVWVGGRHTHPTGFIRDMEKYNLATILGFRLLRCTPKMVKSGEALELVRKALEGGQ